MLIFDSFPSRSKADAFANAVDASRVCASQMESDSYDPFPFLLRPPIVLVERGDNEEEVIRKVEEFGGVFAGT